MKEIVGVKSSQQDAWSESKTPTRTDADKLIDATPNLH
jgi:hypothetical protein